MNLKKILSCLLFTIIYTSVAAQTFELVRPVVDSIQTNGSYLFGEPAISSSSATAHQGIDISIQFDTVYAAHTGLISAVNDGGSCGLYIVIDGYWNEEKLNTIYCHLSEALIAENDSVNAGEPIAISGESGNTTGPHLHFEVRIGRHNGEPQITRSKKNPELWLAMEGMGAIYGFVPDAEYATRVDISPDPKPRPPYDTYGWSLTYTFADLGIGGHPDFNENYAIGDVKPGTYTIAAQNGAYQRQVTVEAGQIVNADAGYTSINEEPVIASEFHLQQNYPNPFNPTSVIGYSLPENSFVNLAVFDLMGTKVAELTNKMMAAGSHEVTFDGSDLSSGVYFYRLTTNQGVITKKMSLIK